MLFGGAFLFLLIMTAAVALNFETSGPTGIFMTELIFFVAMTLFLITLCLILLETHSRGI